MTRRSDIQPNSNGWRRLNSDLAESSDPRASLDRGEEDLRRGPVHIIKRNKPAAVVLSEAEYQRLTQGATQTTPGMTALQWLMAQPPVRADSKEEIDAALAQERNW